MFTTAELRARIQANPQAVSSLVTGLVDNFLDRAAKDLIDPAQVAADLTAGLRATAKNQQFRTWLISQIKDRREKLPRPLKPLRTYLPADLPGALDRAARRNYVPSRELVRAAVDHPATRELVRTILQTTLLEFATRLWTSKKIPGSRLRSGLMGMAKGVAGFVGTDGGLEERVNRFVDGTLSLAIDRIVDRVADPKHADQLATQRALMIRAGLDLPVATVVAETDKFPTQQVEEDVHAIFLAFVDWEQFEPTLRELLTNEIALFGPATVREIFDEAGLLEAWRPVIETQLQQHANFIVQSSVFLDWVTQLCTPGSSDFAVQAAAD